MLTDNDLKLSRRLSDAKTLNHCRQARIDSL